MPNAHRWEDKSSSRASQLSMNSAQSIDGETHRVISSWFMAIYHEFYKMECTSRALAEKGERERSLLLQQKQLLEQQVKEADFGLAGQMEFIRDQTKQIERLENTAMTRSGALQTSAAANSSSDAAASSARRLE